MKMSKNELKRMGEELNETQKCSKRRRTTLKEFFTPITAGTKNAAPHSTQVDGHRTSIPRSAGTKPAIAANLQSTEQVAVQSSEQVAVQSSEQVAAQSTEQVAAQSTEQVAAQSTEQVAAQSTEQVAAQSTEQVAAQSTEQVAAQSTEQVAAQS
eukprot:Lankesteria_metandrocarpae@DN1669_c0_g1_i1.p1